MGLGYRIFGVIIISWLVLVSILYFLANNFFYRHPFMLFAIFSLLLALSLFFLFNHYILKPLEKTLAKLPKNETQSNSSMQLLSNEINDLFDRISFLQEQEIELKKNSEALSELAVKPNQPFPPSANYDNLTSLPNFNFFNEILGKVISNASRHNKSLTVLIINLDNFNTINSNFSYQIGNSILKETAQHISHILRAGDLIARKENDEFIVLLNDVIHPKYVGQVAEKILHVVNQSHQVGTRKVLLTASIGIGSFPIDSQTIDEICSHAEIAMRNVKINGGNNFEYYDTELNIEAHQYVSLENALRNAIANNELALYFQPQLNLHDCKITSMEALLRWKHPEIGLISPDKFIPLAEESGLILQLGEWAINEACHLGKRWQEQGYNPITIAVNISAKQFQNQDLTHVIKTALKNSGLDPSYLEIEVTESAVMENIDSTITKLNDINKMGIAIALDDFGTGYTSITYLRQFPVQILKIDQSFIRHIATSPNDRAIISAVISLGHSLGLKIVAEGIEDAEQLQFLIDNSCDLIQGDFFSKALPEDEIVSKLTKIKP